MAAPSYTEDLNDINDADSPTNWVELTGTGVGDGEAYNVQGPPNSSPDPDYPFIQGQYSVTQDCTKDASVGSLAYPVSAITIPTDGAVFVWQNYMVASNIYNYATGGFRICIGSGLADFNVYFVGGVDKAPYPYGGWDCQVANPTVTRDDYAGTPTGTINYVGGAVYVVTGSSKGEVHNVDVMRYGRGSAIFTQGDAGNGYATIAGFAAQNDTNANRWGLIQETSGGYLWQGRMALGTPDNFVDFRDTNKNIFIKWTPKVTENFNLIEIQNINSYVSMTGFTFQVLDTTTASRGKFLMSDPADVYLDECTFIDMATFIFDTTTGVNVVEITDSVFRRCNEITQGGATFDGCSFINSDATTTIQVDNLDEISNCSFTSDGSNHAIELDSNHAGNSYNLVGCTYTGYAASDGSTGNEVIYNNSGGAVTIYVVGGDVPTVRNGSGASTTVIAAVNWYFEIQNQAGSIVNTAEFRIYDSNNNQLFGVETSDGTELYSFDASISGTPARIVVHDLNYIHFTQTLNHPSASNSATAPVVLTLVEDRVYANDTVTHTKTWGARPTDDDQDVIDAHTKLGNPNTNYGSSSNLDVIDGSTLSTTLFSPRIESFNFPSSSTIVSAVIYFYITSNSLVSGLLTTMLQLNKRFVQSEVTWNNAASGDAWAGPGGGAGNVYGSTGDQFTITVGLTGWISYDVTNDIQDWVDGVRNDLYGWCITHGAPDPGDLVQFASSEYSTDPTLRPYIEITWTT